VSGVFVPKIIKNLVVGFKVTVKNVGDVFLRHSVVWTVWGKRRWWWWWWWV